MASSCGLAHAMRLESIKAASGLPQLTSACVKCYKITVKSLHFMSLLKLNSKKAIYFLQKRLSERPKI